MFYNLLYRYFNNRLTIKDINLINFISGMFKDTIPVYTQSICYPRIVNAFYKLSQLSFNFQLFINSHHFALTFGSYLPQ